MKKNEKLSERSIRKLGHLCYAFEGMALSSNGFDDIHLIHQALPELALEEIKLNTNLCGLSLESPLIINAITGGVPEAEEINRVFAKIAKEFGLAMAVGSQTAGIDIPNLVRSYTVVRKSNPEGIVFANVSANVDSRKAKQAVEMLNADALQLHLNASQELVMIEGDKDFRGVIENIKEIKQAVTVPIIVKEVGFGISRETAKKLRDIGIDAIDIGGKGGTNFIAIEAKRASLELSQDFLHWGIPTSISLLEVLEEVPELDVVATGGITTPMNAVKALALGANAVGMSGWFLRILKEKGENVLRESLKRFLEELRFLFLLCGSSNVQGLRKCPVVITGEVYRWCELRDINIKKYALRNL